MLAWSPRGLVGGSEADNEDAGDRQVKKDTQLVDRGNEQDRSPQPADDRGSADTCYANGR